MLKLWEDLICGRPLSIFVYSLQTCILVSLPKPMLKQLLLYMTTTCLTQPLITCLVPKIKTATAKSYSVEKWTTIHKKYMSLRLYVLYCYVIMQSLFNVNQNWTFIFNIPKIHKAATMATKIKCLQIFYKS